MMMSNLGKESWTWPVAVRHLRDEIAYDLGTDATNHSFASAGVRHTNYPAADIVLGRLRQPESRAALSALAELDPSEPT